jgi:hypothetical protein
MAIGNLKLKINFCGLKHVVRKEKRKDGSEVECLIIPIEQNHLFKGEKGGLYLDMTAIESTTPPKEGFKDTHFIKQSLPKEVYEKMTDEEKKATPILGNLFPWSSFGSDNHQVVEQGDDENLPF